MRIYLIGAVALLLMTINVFAQENNIRVGSIPRTSPLGGAYFDFSDPNTVNMKIGIWGYVKNPGRYTLPVNTTIMEALSYAGGPEADALAEDIRILRTGVDSTQEVIKFDYNQLLHEANISKTVKDIRLHPGDMILLPGEPRFYLRDYLSTSISLISALSSLTILIISIVRK